MTEQPKTKYEIASEFYKRWPDYDTWTAQDFEKMDETGLRMILGTIAFKSVPAGTLIPNSFVEQYGENASYELTRVALQEAARRGLPDLSAKGTLNGGMRSTFNIPNNQNIDLTPLTSVTLTDGSVREATPPQILSYETSQNLANVAASNETNRKAGTYTPVTATNVDVPREAIEAIVKANPGIVPQNAEDKQIWFPVKDEAAYMAGYATRTGAHESIGAIDINYPASAICGAQRAAAQALNPNKPDIDVALAWVAGGVQADVDHMTAEQRNAVAVCPPLATPTSGIANGGNGTSSVNQPGSGGNPLAAPSAKGR